MSCGTCGKPDDLESARAQACSVCVHARKTGFVACSVSGLPLVVDGPKALANRACPRGHMVDRHDGSVRWFGIVWYGVPFPLRALRWPILSYWWNAPMPTKPFEGCGCIKRLKDWWEHVGEAVRDGL